MTQEWVVGLSFMQQSVLLSALRGPDTVKHPAEKAIKRWFRRCILYSAFESRKTGQPVRFCTATEPGGGSFTGPLPSSEYESLDDAARSFSAALDLFPHHYIVHMIGAAEIVGFKHDNPSVREWWRGFYLRLVRRLHMHPETEAEMDRRLGDDEELWRATEK